MRTIAIAAGLLFALNLPVEAGQIYTWVDAQGVTHFEAQPPRDAASTALTLPKTARATSSTSAPAQPDPRQQLADTQVKQQLARQEAQRRSFCEQARSNLAQLQNNPHLSENVEGGVRRLNEEQRQQRITETRKALENHCH
ncbi:DUF4124 domain-containing protein [Pseudomonas chlororaphis]|uniref:Glycosyltransferase n=1 Tax=Pseudomonas chlororaphis TaxID=587753 RepID=A0A1Q8EJN9_9PSED|nr:DUF4124 domain-containing protein [Pseudomonas chlororaphis]OLF51989.1 glycosyltransferase [Pseudomonas chlororaphis]